MECYVVIIILSFIMYYDHIELCSKPSDVHAFNFVMEKIVTVCFMH